MMRRLFEFALAAFVALGLFPASHAQDAFSVEIIKDADLRRDQMYDGVLLWLAENAVSSKAVIDMKDKEMGVVVGTASTDVSLMFTKMALQFKLRIDVKDSRYRMTFSQVKLIDAGMKPIEDANRTSLEPRAREQFEKLATSLQAYLASETKSKAW
ncbi:DUF4468 domain-containing protein [Leptospira sp. 96542]|nr:DUF4468 domain-containing protein [Leptospira sp. 96542]